MITRITQIVLAVFVLLLESTPAQDVPESKIVSLQKELTEAGETSSATRKRRAYKSVVRDGEKLLNSSPEASNRFSVLEIVFQSQKRLLALDKSAANREALLKTCASLAGAPDEVANLRLEADLLLSEQELAQKNADVKERALALAEMIARYRDTPGEAKCLMIASQIAPKLEAFDLEMQILRAMQDRFADNHEVIEFRRKSLAAGRIEALFRGEFERADGTVLSFPIDRVGHPCLMVFWSKQTQGFDFALKQMNEVQEQYQGHFDVFSMNLDELPDAGAKTLESLGLDWTVMRLPDGKMNQAFRTFGRRDPVSILVNAYGYTLLTPTNDYGRGHGGAVNPYKFDDVRVTSPRYTAQIQSLIIGDFLVADSGNPKAGALADSLGAIQDCFVKVPFRYRLSGEEAMANYEKAAQLCADAIAKHPQDPELWRVRNRQIIALLGMWKMAAEPRYLKQAAVEARTLLAGTLPDGADIVARFCLTKEALRNSDTDAESILSGLVSDAGGAGPAVAAAAILALDANSTELHQHYREILLKDGASDPALWEVAAFLRDRFHTLDLLKVKLTRGERRVRSRYGYLVSPRAHAVNHGIDPMTERLPEIELKTLDSGALKLPPKTQDKLTLVMFVEPPADPEADFPVPLDKNGKPSNNDPLRQVMGYAAEFADRHIYNEVEVITAFLCDDALRVKSLMKKNQWPFKAAIVPGGLNNPIVRRLGILSADRIPNVFLLRRDGTVAWHTSGFTYKSDFGYPFAIRLAIKVHIEVCDTELAYKALAKREFAKAKKIFSGPFLPEKDERYAWRAPRFHGRALANMGLKDWDAALADIDTAIEAHKADYDRKEDERGASYLLLHSTRAIVLEKLGRSNDAKAAREAAEVAPAPYSTTIYDHFHSRLEKLRSETP